MSDLQVALIGAVVGGLPISWVAQIAATAFRDARQRRYVAMLLHRTLDMNQQALVKVAGGLTADATLFDTMFDFSVWDLVKEDARRLIRDRGGFTVVGIAQFFDGLRRVEELVVAHRASVARRDDDEMSERVAQHIVDQIAALAVFYTSGESAFPKLLDRMAWRTHRWNRRLLISIRNREERFMRPSADPGSSANMSANEPTGTTPD